MINISIDPTVLLICPIRNESQWVGKMIKSIQKQSHKNWILFFYDNASTDETYEIISSYQNYDGRIHSRHSEDFVHINKNFDRAIQEALLEFTFDYVSFVGGDDEYLEVDYLENLIREMESGAGIALPSFREVSMIDGHVRILKISCVGKSRWLNLIQSAANTDNVALLYALFRASDFFKLTGSPKARFSINMSSDWWFSFRALVEVAAPPSASAHSTYVKNRKWIPFNSEHYTARLPLNTNAPKNKVGFAFWKTFCEPTIHFFSESDRYSIYEFPKIVLLWQIMIYSRVIMIFKNKIRIFSCAQQ